MGTWQILSSRTHQAVMTAFCCFVNTVPQQKTLILFDMSPGVERRASEDAGERQVHRYVKTTLPLPAYSFLYVLITVSFISIRCLCVSYVSKLIRQKSEINIKKCNWAFQVYLLSHCKQPVSLVNTLARNNLPVDTASHARRLQSSTTPLWEAKILRCFSSWIQWKKSVCCSPAD